MSAKKPNRSYTADFKRRAILKAEEMGFRPAAKKFGWEESNLRRWVKNKSVIFKMSKRSRSLPRRTAQWPELEKKLADWITSQRAVGRPISTVLLRLKAKMLAAEDNVPGFTGGQGWCWRFMRRHKFSKQVKTTVGQKLPDNWEEKVSLFHQFVARIIREKCIPHAMIVNMDEVPLSFDAPPNRTVNPKGAKTVYIRTTGHEKTNFTVVLACAADGSKLKPMVIFKRITIPKESFPIGIVIKANKKGWMKEEVMLEWLQENFPTYSPDDPKALLILDSMSAHIGESVKESTEKRHACLGVIPGGLTKILQPLDLTVNRVFKLRVRALWERWMSEGLHEYTKTGRMKKASFAEVCRWVDEAWSAVKSSTIIKAFQTAGIIPKGASTSEQPAESFLSDSEDESDVDDDCDAPNNLSEQIMSLFCSDTEASDFEGFEEESETEGNDVEDTDIMKYFWSDDDCSVFEGFDID